MATKTLTILGLSLLLSTGAMAQVKSPQPSPKIKMSQTIGLAEVELEYSRPGVKGRDVFGDLVSYGKLWRTGANKNTIITFSDDVKINGQELKAGKYSIFSVPSENEWTVYFYTDTEIWGNPKEINDEKVALKTTASVSKVSESMESFLIYFDHLRDNSSTLKFAWQNTVATLKIEVPTSQLALESVEKTMAGPTAGDYYSSAQVYRKAGKELEKAYEWISKAVDITGTSKFWIVYEKALIEVALGKKKDAVATAKIVKEGAEKSGNDTYVKRAQNIIDNKGKK